MTEYKDEVSTGNVYRARLDPLEDIRLLERLHTELSARIYCTQSESEKFRLLALQSEIETVLEYQ